MPAPTTNAEFTDLVQKSGVAEATRLGPYLQGLRDRGSVPADPQKLAGLMVRDGLLTYFQADQLLKGKWKRFTIGKYKVLEQLGSGGMGQVFLCEHTIMRRRVAVKVLPTAKADDPAHRERFYREARAAAALDHPNLVRAFDIDQSDNLHFLVMEYIDGASLFDLVKRSGPLEPYRACHYIYWSAVGLQYAFEVAGLVHRDIKPGNILVDRQGVVKILDMGLARFFNDEDDLLTKNYDQSTLGTADYLSPEQVEDSHQVDIRADIYSLGATFYSLLAGRPPFHEGTVTQKLIWHQTKAPKPIAEIRSDVPPGVRAILDKMMAKDREARYQTPGEVAEALAPYVQTPIPPPSDTELPRLSAAATGTSTGSTAVSGRHAVPRPVPAGGRSGSSASYTPLTSPRPPAAGQDESNPFSNLLAPEPATPRPAAPDAYASAAARAAARAGPAAPLRRSVLLWVVLGAIAVAAAAAALTIYLNSSRPKAGPAAAEVPTGPRDWVVTGDPKAGECRTAQEALAKAKPGDRVVLRGDVHVEPRPVHLRKNQGNRITVVSGNPDGRPVTWRLPADANATHEYLLEVIESEDFRVRGIAFDGQNRAESGVRVGGACPGLALEGVHVTGFRTSGVRLTNCTNDEGRRATLRNLRVRTAHATPLAGIVLQGAGGPAKATQNVTVSDCRIEGLLGAAVVIEGSATGVVFERNRIAHADAGVRWTDLSDKGAALNVEFAGNTFYAVKEVVVVAAPLPPYASIGMKRNLFARADRLLHEEKPGKAATQQVTWFGNVRDNSVKDAASKSLAAEKPVAFASTDPNSPKFLTYPKTSPLAKAAPGDEPVGASPE